MRFSILTADLGLLDRPESEVELEPFSQFIAENNVSCVCVQGCTRSRETPPYVENAVSAIADQLGRFGLKYDRVWDAFGAPGAGPTCGCAILTQLPVLGRAARQVSPSNHHSEAGAGQVSAVRLGISPEVVIDVFSIHLSEATQNETQVAELLQFVAGSAATLAPQPDPGPRRRGRPPRVSQADRPTEPARMIFLAGNLSDSSGTDGQIIGAGYTNGLAAAPDLLQREPAAAARSNRGAIYLRPGLRPTDALTVSITKGHAGNHGRLLAFEV